MAVPFTLTGEILLFSAESTTMILVATVLTAVGGAVGQIVTTLCGGCCDLALHRHQNPQRHSIWSCKPARVPEKRRAIRPDSTDDLWLSQSNWRIWCLPFTSTATPRTVAQRELAADLIRKRRCPSG